MGIHYNKMKKQLRFCSELMERLKNDIDNSTLIASYGLEKATRLESTSEGCGESFRSYRICWILITN